MKCIKCSKYVELPESLSEMLEEKGRLMGEKSLRISCDGCSACYMCYTDGKDQMERCQTCGFHYHKYHQSENPPGVCKKCAEIRVEADYRALVGPEIPFLERKVEELDKNLVKKITDIVKKNKTPKKSQSGIKEIRIGDARMVPSFSSPFPEEYARQNVLYVCESCLEYFATEFVLKRHQKKCLSTLPPGEVVYHDSDNLGVFRVEGSTERTFCQSLCLIGKMFLDHKTLYYDVEPFLFYVVGELVENRFKIFGYFSKEREEGANNLSCIVVFPPYRRIGLGSFLIDFSYHLTRTGNSPPYTAGPEQPLSEEGEKAYSAYWKDTVVRYILVKKEFAPTAQEFSEMSAATGVASDTLKKMYSELEKTYVRKSVYGDLQAAKDNMKKIRRVKRNGLFIETKSRENSPLVDLADSGG